MNGDELNLSCVIESFSNAINMRQINMDINKREWKTIIRVNISRY
jgi:hypothetical protein